MPDATWTVPPALTSFQAGASYDPSRVNGISRTTGVQVSTRHRTTKILGRTAAGIKQNRRLSTFDQTIVIQGAIAFSSCLPSLALRRQDGPRRRRITEICAA